MLNQYFDEKAVEFLSPLFFFKSGTFLDDSHFRGIVLPAGSRQRLSQAKHYALNQIIEIINAISIGAWGFSSRFAIKQLIKFLLPPTLITNERAKTKKKKQKQKQKTHLRSGNHFDRQSMRPFLSNSIEIFMMNFVFVLVSRFSISRTINRKSTS